MGTSDDAADGKIKLLTYNIWCNEHVAVYRRMQSISDLIARHDPDVIFFQEMTSYMKDILRRSPWWGQYSEFTAGQDCFAILLTKLRAQPREIVPETTWPRLPPPPKGMLSRFLDWKCREHRLHVATCQFPAPTQSDIRSTARLDKANAFLEHFGETDDSNAVLAGDMNWDEDLDGPFPIEGRAGWVDAWCELRGGEDGAGGWTYDSVANPMLRSFKPGRTRPDRFFCKLRDFNLDSIEMVGTEAIPGITYYDDKGNQLPVLPSHHFGMLLTISPKQQV